MIFKHQEVSDLAFILQAPLIYQDIDISQFWLADSQQRLVALDHDPSELLGCINVCKSHFLGSYFETLFSFALNHLSSLKVILEHEQLISPVRTLGEIDALVTTQDGAFHQFEVAIKFYLESNQERDHWVGPNKNDSFVKKYQRANNHQLVILDLPEAKPFLQEKGIIGPIQRHLLMFGLLYTQVVDIDDLLNLKPVEATLGGQINEAAKTGSWISEAHLSRLAPYFESCQELVKPFWVSNPVMSDPTFTLYKDWESDISVKFQTDERPRHFLFKGKHLGKPMNAVRIFVVPNSW